MYISHEMNNRVKTI